VIVAGPLISLLWHPEQREDSPVMISLAGPHAALLAEPKTSGAPGKTTAEGRSARPAPYTCCSPRKALISRQRASSDVHIADTQTCRLVREPNPWPQARNIRFVPSADLSLSELPFKLQVRSTTIAHRGRAGLNARPSLRVRWRTLSRKATAPMQRPFVTSFCELVHRNRFIA
jgi:hypothetical protein